MAYSVIVIGGGLSGLTAALHLAEQGLHPLILEAEPDRPGGRLAADTSVELTQNGKSYSFPGEHGIHAIWGQYHNFRDMLSRLDINPGYRPSRREAWVLRGPGSRVRWSEGGSALRSSWIPAPLHYLALFVRPRFLQMLTLRDLASMFRVLGGLIFALAYDPAAEGAPLRGYTLADYFKGWSPTLQALFTGLARNFASEAPEKVPQSGFIAFLRFYTLLRRDAWAFNYFDRDAGRAFLEPLIDRIQAAGGTLQMNTRVTHLEKRDGGWRVCWEGGSAETEQIVLAVESPTARQIIEASPDLAQAGISLVWPLAIPTAVMRFWFRQTPKLMAEAGIFTGSFTIDNFFWLHRFQRDFEAWHQETGGGAVEVHIYGPPELLQEPDAVLLARAVLDLGRVWPELRTSMIAQSIRRNAPVHTLFDSDGAQLAVKTPWEGIAACGDWVRYPHPSLYMERATVTGIAAANTLLAERGLPVAHIKDAAPPEPLARWLQARLKWVRRRAAARKRRQKFSGQG